MPVVCLCKNRQKGVAAYLEGAMKDDKWSQFELSQCYYSGRGIEKDEGRRRHRRKVRKMESDRTFLTIFATFVKTWYISYTNIVEEARY